MGDISYTSRVIASFVSNFVAMAKWVGRGRICLTSFNSTTVKAFCWAQGSRRYLFYTLSCSRFCLKLHCHGNMGHPSVNLNDAIKLALNSWLKRTAKPVCCGLVCHWTTSLTQTPTSSSSQMRRCFMSLRQSTCRTIDCTSRAMARSVKSLLNDLCVVGQLFTSRWRFQLPSQSWAVQTCFCWTWRETFVA